MDGIHDMGGMDGFGKVEPEPNEPPFHAAWEGRVLAMQRAMGYAGAWQIDMSRFAQERLPPQVYITASYYQRWALAMERNLVERGYADAEELAAGHALPSGQAAQAQAHDRRRPARHDARLVLPSGAGARAFQARRPGSHQEHPSADAYQTAALRARTARRGATRARLSRIP
jgi:hypothetical protein